MAPITLKVMAIFRPERRCGRAEGTCTRHRISPRLAPTEPISATNERSTDCMPASMSSVTGKNAMVTIRTTFAVSA